MSTGRRSASIPRTLRFGISFYFFLGILLLLVCVYSTTGVTSVTAVTVTAAAMMLNLKQSKGNSRTRALYLYSSAEKNIVGSADNDDHDDDDEEDVRTLNAIFSAAVTLQDASVQNGILSVIRSVKDIDNGKSRKFLYTIPIPQGQAFFPFLIPPSEVSESIKARIPSPSGERMAILKEEKEENTSASTTSTSTQCRQVMEIWTKGGESLTRRVVLPKTLHGKVIHQPDGLGTIQWNTDETALVYSAERNAPTTQSFFTTNRQSQSQSSSQSIFSQKNNKNNKKYVVGAQHTLGYGKTERWGEKYTKMAGLVDLYLLHTGTGNVARINNVPLDEVNNNNKNNSNNNNSHDKDDSTTTTSTSTTTTTTMGGYVLGQACFSPCGTHVVYTGWDAGGGGEMPRRLGMIYCYNRPSKLYASPIQHLMTHLADPTFSSLIDENNNNYYHDTSTTTTRTSPRKGSSNTLPQQDGPCLTLTESSRLSRSPRFSPPIIKGVTISRLCYLTSELGFDTHNGAVSLNVIDWHITSGTPYLESQRVLVSSSLDAVQSNNENAVHVANMSFPGLYVSELPLQCCTEDFIFTTTQWGSVQKVVRISLDDGTVSLVNVNVIERGFTSSSSASSAGGGGSGCGNAGPSSSDSIASQHLMCIDAQGGAIVTDAAPNRPAIVAYVSASSLSRRPNVSSKVEAMVICEMGPIASSSFSTTRERDIYQLLNFKYEVFLMNMSPEQMDQDEDLAVPVQWIFLKPTTTKRNGSNSRGAGAGGTSSSSLSSSSPPPPLIVVPHGGPHSCTPTSYLPAYAFLCAQGYAVLHVNYRGSTGFGQRALEALPGHVGNLDVKDLLHAVETITEAGWADKHRVGICGGSHGGFLASHCIGQFPEIFKVAAMRNPVTNIATMTTATDIADWCYVESIGCGYYNPRKFRGATSEELKTMWDSSPIRYADRVVAPTLVALGMQDQRVPPSQGLEFYHTLRSNGVTTKLLQYDNDDHAIDQIQSEADMWINIKRWFDEHL